MNRLFISHAEKDRSTVKDFVELLYHIGLSEENIFCSSISELGVPLKEDIYSYLRKLLDSDAVIPIFMLSENYYASAACLNEMGAVWMKQKDYYTFLLPGFTFKEIRGAINPNKRAIKFDNARRALQNDLTSFKNSLVKTFNLTPISEQRWEVYRDEFVDKISSINQNTEIIIDVRESQTFCINDVNHGACERIVDKICNKVVFQFDFYKTTSQLCSLVFFTGGLNLLSAYQSGKKLEFWIKASDKVKEVRVEMHLPSMNPERVVHTNSAWQKISIPLCEFTTLQNLWECCKEICFVVDRVIAKRGTIEIKDIRII